MVVGSAGKGRRTYHTEDCPYAKRIVPERQIHFCTVVEAEAAGYHGCAYCSWLGTAFRKASREIHVFCGKVKFTCHFVEGRIAIQTPVDKWLLVYLPEKRRVAVYHENHGCQAEKGPVHGYHNQHWRFQSIPDTLRRIYHHTMAYLKRPKVPRHVKGKVCQAYGTALPPGTSKRNRSKKKRFLKAAERREKADRVLALIKGLSSR